MEGRCGNEIFSGVALIGGAISARSGMPETLSVKIVSPMKTFVRRKERRG